MLTTREYIVDLSQYPKETDPPQLNEILTLGDLHGNVLKLLYFLLITHQVYIPQSHFVEFKNIYKKSVLNSLSKTDIEHFSHLLSLAIFPTQTRVKLRFLGDFFADRGGNDYLTLMVLDSLHKNGFSLEIVFSNHDLEFIGAYESDFSKNYPSLSVIFPSEKMSLLHFIALKNNPQILLPNINTLILRSYYSKIKLIDYELPNAAHPSITLYTHAPIGLSIIEKIALFLGIDYRDASVEDLAQTLDRMNALFTNILHRKQGMTGLYQYLAENHCLQLLIWNRYNNTKDWPHPHKKNNYLIYYVHGHDNYGALPAPSLHRYVTNLDSELGKLGCDQGTLVIAVSS